MPRSTEPEGLYRPGAITVEFIGCHTRWQGFANHRFLGTFSLPPSVNGGNGGRGAAAPADGVPRIRTMKMKNIRHLLLVFLLSLPFTVLAAGAVNINTADAQTIASSLTGIGQAKAEAIVEYREANGPFRSVEDLLQVKGIGEKTLEANRERIRLE